MQQGKLIEGVDYYFNKDGLMVLTAQFLLKRGYCCGNGCLHCPYKDGKEDTANNQSAEKTGK